MSDKRCQTCFNLTAYCTCNQLSPQDQYESCIKGEWTIHAVNQDASLITEDALRAAFYGTPESRHPSAAPPRHLHAVPDVDETSDAVDNAQQDDQQHDE